MIQKQSYGTLPDGREVDQYTLTNTNGACCRVITYGGIITELRVPDRKGDVADVVLGHSSLESYLKGHPHFGAITGRVAGRITNGKFTLDGTDYQLVQNNEQNHLHGGVHALDKKLWNAETSDDVLTLSYVSPDGEEGYPGNVSIQISYSLSDENELKLEYRATTDAATPLSLTNHSYFNLAGEGTLDLNTHRLQIFADTIVPKLEDGTLTGVPTSVEGTQHDFREETCLKAFTQENGEHGENYLLRKENAEKPTLVALVTEPESGRKMETWTTATVLQLYCSQQLEDVPQTGKSGVTYPNFSAICLECQGYPEGVNQPEIDDIILRPGQEYHQITSYRFSVV
ncbi:MAG: galactose mutarotase [Kiritimatiellae bacterium]|jgi:aldose 1-epimerase|nr:galactose mutarotase [Kiritimatiellia bacterium]